MTLANRLRSELRTDLRVLVASPPRPHTSRILKLDFHRFIEGTITVFGDQFLSRSGQPEILWIIFCNVNYFTLSYHSKSHSVSALREAHCWRNEDDKFRSNNPDIFRTLCIVLPISLGGELSPQRQDDTRRPNCRLTALSANVGQSSEPPTSARPLLDCI
jgi:hypothetical protein